MNTSIRVLGVLAVCGVDLQTLHSAKPRISRDAGQLCKVCKVYAHARAHTEILNIREGATGSLFPYARTQKPYQPYTPYTDALKALILLGLPCVGFVLGWLNLCWVQHWGVSK